MNDDLANQIDSEMDGMLNDGQADPASAGSPGNGSAPVQTPAPSSWKAGGREFKSPEEMAKAYDNVWKLHSKFQNEAKPWMQLRDHLNEHPELRQKYAAVTQEYHKAREAGLSPKQAEQAVQLPPAVQQQIRRMEAQFEDLQMEREIGSLKAKFKLDNSAVKEVLSIAEANGGAKLESAYKIWAHDKGLPAAKAEGAKEARQAADASRVGGTAPAVQGAQKGINMRNDRDWRSSASDALGKMGIRDY